MVVQSILSVNNLQNPVSSDAELGSEVGSGQQELITCNESSAKKRAKIKASLKSGKSQGNVIIEEEDSKQDSEEKAPSGRRCSARIQEKQNIEKVRLVNQRVELLDDENGSGSRKKARRKGNFASEVEKSELSKETETGKETKVDTAILGAKEATHCAVDGDGDGDGGELMNQGVRVGEQNGVVNESVSGNVVEKSAYAKVKETLRAFNKHYLHFVQVGVF